MDWPFDQQPNVAAITTVGVLERGLPILVVQIGFVNGTPDARPTADRQPAGQGR